jgi:Holliday junction resolvase RusA-like endonuclease
MTDEGNAIDLVSSPEDESDDSCSSRSLQPSHSSVIKQRYVNTQSQTGVKKMKRVPAFHPSNNIDVTNSTKGEIQFCIIGSPVPLRRQRFNPNSGNTYNPSRQDIKDFRAAIDSTLAKVDVGKIRKNTLDAWGVSLEFRLRRPNSHFVCSKRVSPQRLKAGAPKRWPICKTPDVDNMAKFVLDSLQGQPLFFKDDCRVMKISVEKYYDNEGDGSTIVRVKSL